MNIDVLAPALWHYGATPMRPGQFLEASLGVVERAIAAVCAQASLRGDPGDPRWFGGKTKTDFVWTMVDFVQKKQ